VGWWGVGVSFILTKLSPLLLLLSYFMGLFSSNKKEEIRGEMNRLEFYIRFFHLLSLQAVLVVYAMLNRCEHLAMITCCSGAES